MKYLLGFILLISSIAKGQSTYYIRADTIVVQKVGGNTTFKIENATRAKTGAYLRNYSGGRTDWSYAVDSGSISGSNLVLWRGGGTQNVTIGIGAGTAWNLTGNAGTTAGTNFVGTTDAVALVVKTNNAERIRVLSTGNVGVGINNPAYKLDVYGGFNARAGIDPGTIRIGTGGDVQLGYVDDSYFLQITENNVTYNDQALVQYFMLDANANDFYIKQIESSNLGKRLSLNASNREYQFGDVDGVNTGDKIYINAASSTGFYDNTAHDGKFGINTNTPEASLHTVGTLRFVTGNQGANKVLVSDGDGDADWVDGTTIGRRFGVSGEDATAAQNRTFTTSGFQFQLYGQNGTKRQLIRTLADSTLGMYLRNASDADLATFIISGSDTSLNLNVTTGKSFKVKPSGLYANGLASSANAGDSMLVINTTGDKIGYRAIPSGATINSAAQYAIPYYATNPTGTTLSGASGTALNSNGIGFTVTQGANVSVLPFTDGIFYFRNTISTNNGLVAEGGSFSITNSAGTALNNGAFVFNDGGAAVNFRIESDGDANNFFSDGTNNRIGIGTGSPADKFHVVGVTNTTKLKGNSSTPGIAAGIGAGTTPPTLSVTGTDLAGTITLITDTDPAADELIFTVTFSSAYGATPHVVFSNSNANTGQLTGDRIGVYSTATTTTFTLSVIAGALTASTEYIWSYHVIQ